MKVTAMQIVSTSLLELRVESADKTAFLTFKARKN